MKNTIKLILSLFILIIVSCSPEDEGIKDKGIPTEIRGNVSDNIRGINIVGYKIKLVKNWRSCSNWMCGWVSEEIETVYTDSYGNYTIKFNYKLNEGESYAFEEQYYGTPYYPEYLPSSSSGVIAGQTNIKNINAWKPIQLKLNLNILNNNFAPLHVRNEIGDSNESFLNTENIYEPNINKSYYLGSRPNSDIKIIFWYYTGSNPVPTLHQKTVLYHTTLEDVNELNYTIDCSTF